jgi:hypothetical protein
MAIIIAGILLISLTPSVEYKNTKNNNSGILQDSKIHSHTITNPITEKSDNKKFALYISLAVFFLFSFAFIPELLKQGLES